VLILALDTATPAVTAGLVRLPESAAEAPEQVAARVTVDARAHGELLTPHVLDAVGEAGASLADVAAVVVGTGPGPYTGLRAGLVTGAALAHSLGVPAFPVCTLDAIAAGSSAAGPLVVVTDARRREVYWATYDAGTADSEWGRRLDGPHVGPRADVPESPGATLLDHEQPTPLGLVTVAAEAIRADAEPGPLTPLYLRRPDAAEPSARKRVTT